MCVVVVVVACCCFICVIFFTLIVHTQAVESMNTLPTDSKNIVIANGLLNYSRTSKSHTLVEQDLSCLMACYSAVPTMRRNTSSTAVANVVSELVLCDRI